MSRIVRMPLTMLVCDRYSDTISYTWADINGAIKRAKCIFISKPKSILSPENYCYMYHSTYILQSLVVIVNVVTRVGP